MSAPPAAAASPPPLLADFTAHFERQVAQLTGLRLLSEVPDAPALAARLAALDQLVGDVEGQCDPGPPGGGPIWGPFHTGGWLVAQRCGIDSCGSHGFSGLSLALVGPAGGDPQQRFLDNSSTNSCPSLFLCPLPSLCNAIYFFVATPAKGTKKTSYVH